MKPTALLFALISCMLGVSALADNVLYDGTNTPSAKPSTVPSKAKPNAFTSREGGYTVVFPDGWVIEEDLDEDGWLYPSVMIVDEDADGDTYMAGATMTAGREMTRMTSSEAMQEIIKTITDDLPSYAPVKSGTIMVQNETTHWHIYRCTVDDIPVMIIIYVYTRGNMVYALSCITNDEMTVWTRHRNIFDTIAQSVRFFKPTL